MSKLQHFLPLLAALGVLSLLSTQAGCGAKTGLSLAGHEDPSTDADIEIDGELDADVVEDADVDADVEIEADIEADVEVEADLEIDADLDICEPSPVTIDRRRAEVTFVIDRSASMQWGLDGFPGGPGDPSRWELLRDALGEALRPSDHLLEVGAKFFPRAFSSGETPVPELACMIDTGLELVPAPENTEELLGVFEDTMPEGGTPTQPALATVREHIADHERPGVARFVVLATDGGPNCNPDAIPGEDCVCTGPPEYCDESVGGTYNCLDDVRTLTVIEEISAALSVPVFVIGIDDPTREDLADFLDEMAIAGGRPRAEPTERRFYSVHRPEELHDAVSTITESIALCLFTVPHRFVDDPLLEIVLDGEVVPFDPTREDGWDWTAPEVGELTLFGESCASASLPDSRLRARLTCD